MIDAVMEHRSMPMVSNMGVHSIARRVKRYQSKLSEKPPRA